MLQWWRDRFWVIAIWYIFLVLIKNQESCVNYDISSVPGTGSAQTSSDTGLGVLSSRWAMVHPVMPCEVSCLMLTPCLCYQLYALYIPWLKRLFEWLQCNILNKWIWLHDRKLWNVIHYVIDCSVRVVWRAIAIRERKRERDVLNIFSWHKNYELPIGKRLTGFCSFWYPL